MKINIHAGHNADGQIACGAIGIIKESTEARNVKNKVIELLRENGHTVYDCTVDNASDQKDNLSKIVAKCNGNNVDLDVAIHFNAAKEKDLDGDGINKGCEVYTYDTNPKTTEYAKNICNALSELGFRNRGVKVDPTLYVLKNTKAPALLIECCFVDDKDDTDLYNSNEVADAIVKGLLATQTSQESTNNAKPPAQEEQSKGFSEYLVKINTKALNVRKGPGTNFDVTKTLINDKNKYTIVDEQDGNGASKWCKLKSGIGWISKDFVTVVK